ncbi:MAG TPA: hypothetical protein VKR43_17685, partial [Bryobacteraceae bacterium]|nr:hypothetical protein [Bryobacteraceae bacterium]
ITSPALPLEFSGVPAAAGEAPRLGEHTREILLAAGIAPEEIDDLAQRKIVQCSRPKNNA